MTRQTECYCGDQTKQSLTNVWRESSYLDVLALDLVVENMGNVLVGNLLSSSSSVNSDHGDSDRPGSVANRHLQVRVVCAQVVAVEQVLYHYHQTVQNGAVCGLKTVKHA